MKKSLIALAVFGAFSGAALAQSNVTLYGILDVNYQRIDPEQGDSQSGINGGHQSGNRFQVRIELTIRGGDVSISHESSLHTPAKNRGDDEEES